MTVKLGLNIDHVATLRNARGGTEPKLEDAARAALGMGAESIVIHLRHDRRHIKDADVEKLCKLFPGRIHLECAATAEMERIALKYKPASVCLVPEFEGERTTRGGLNLNASNTARIKKITNNLRKANIAVSLFINPAAADARAAKNIGADIVELCTAKYSEAKNKKESAALLEDLAVCSILARELGLEVHAGHGLDYSNAAAVANLDGMECLNIGFAIIAKSVFIGLAGALLEMTDAVK
ncbi:MAG: pyridoxine 5'-phosphate synthase [Elusimicrobium sp.]|jgi:pyridoxine 5-phosphate synthase|nr:pyridoxine 5'-phosphate synthase [Elusimicrobium sp.]